MIQPISRPLIILEANVYGVGVAAIAHPSILDVHYLLLKAQETAKEWGLSPDERVGLVLQEFDSQQNKICQFVCLIRLSELVFSAGVKRETAEAVRRFRLYCGPSAIEEVVNG